MAQIANVEYFALYCNKRLGTNYTWNSKQAINIEWLVGITRKVYNDIHQPKNGCRLLLSSVFSYNISKQAVDTELANKVINYLTFFNRICDTDCDCPCKSSNCSTNCGTCGNCCNNCACDCGNPMECDCDSNCGTCVCIGTCSYSACDWTCNCVNTPNYCASQCACACNCCDDCSDCKECSDCGDCVDCFACPCCDDCGRD